jgi:hypothetical protein
MNESPLDLKRRTQEFALRVIDKNAKQYHQPLGFSLYPFFL